MTPDLFPRPREISPTGAAVPAGWRLREEAGAPDLPAQGYRSSPTETASSCLDRDAVEDELASLADEHRERWLERSRPGGQPDSERHLRRAAAAHQGGDRRSSG